MNQLTNTQTLDGFVFISPKMTIWSGKTALQFDQELGVHDSDNILTGSKEICPPLALRKLRSLRSNLEVRIAKVAIPFLSPSIWAVPLEKLDVANAICKDVEDSFSVYLNEFLTGYDQACEDFFAGKKFEAQLRQAKLPLAEVEKRFSFRLSTFQCAISDHTNVTMDDLFGAFCIAIADDARAIKKAWDQRGDKTELAKVSVKSLYDLCAKIKSFSSTSAHASALGQYVEDKLLSELPLQKLTVESQIQRGYELLATLANEATLFNFGEALLQLRQAKFTQSVNQQAVTPSQAPQIASAVAMDLGLPLTGELQQNSALATQEASDKATADDFLEGLEVIFFPEDTDAASVLTFDVGQMQPVVDEDAEDLPDVVLQPPAVLPVQANGIEVQNLSVIQPAKTITQPPVSTPVLSVEVVEDDLPQSLDTIPLASDEDLAFLLGSGDSVPAAYPF